MKTDTLERIVPDELSNDGSTGTETYKLHLERYAFAAQHVSGNVLDAACGVGYGSLHLAGSDRVAAVHGIDLDEGAVAYAKSRYAHPKTIFTSSDILAFRPDRPFDSIVSLETIEHVPDPQALIAHFTSMLRPGGVFVGSVPVTPSVDANPHHLTDFTPSSFKELLTGNGLVVESEFGQVQPFSPIGILSGQEKRAKNIRPNLLSYYLSHPEAAVARAVSTLRYGFTNRYLTVQCRKV